MVITNPESIDLRLSGLPAKEVNALRMVLQTRIAVLRPAEPLKIYKVHEASLIAYYKDNRPKYAFCNHPLEQYRQKELEIGVAPQTTGCGALKIFDSKRSNKWKREGNTKLRLS